MATNQPIRPSDFGQDRSVLVGGQWRAGSGDPVEVVDPATEQVLTTLAGGSPEDGVAAVAAADAAAAGWAATSPRERSVVLRRAYEAMVERTEEIAALMVAENGKSLDDARGEVAYAAEFFRWFSEEAVRIDGHFGVSPAGGTRTLVQRRPVGVALLVTPWNFPAAMITRKVAPALAAGCTVVVKPPSETPLTALLLGEILAEAGAPDGVVNVVPSADSGSFVSAVIAERPVRKLSFTGSTRVGSILLEQAAERALNCSMELGGNAPFVVTDTADVAAAVDGAMVAKFRNGGQACTAANRFYVHRSVHDEFVELFGERVRALSVGAGADGAQIGPVITAKARDDLQQLVDDAVAAGAEVLARADVPEGPGYWVAPQVLGGIKADAEILQHELFGPVAPVVAWEDDDELVAAVNSTETGLSSYLYDQDLQRAMRLAERFDVGMVGVNRGLVSDPAAPFGGTRGSGLGREGASEGLEAFLETQYLSIDW